VRGEFVSQASKGGVVRSLWDTPLQVSELRDQPINQALLLNHNLIELIQSILIEGHFGLYVF
jgi:hypothetical protein